MGLKRSFIFQLFTLCLAAYTVFAQPNLPACWMERIPCQAHIHPGGHVDQPHSHEYLFDNTQGASSALPNAFSPFDRLLELMRTTPVGFSVTGPAQPATSWDPFLSTPPPRQFSFF